MPNNSSSAVKGSSGFHFAVRALPFCLALASTPALTQTDAGRMAHPSVLMEQAQAYAASGRLDLARNNYLLVLNDPRSAEVFVIAYPNSKINLSTVKDIARQNLSMLDAREAQLRAAQPAPQPLAAAPAVVAPTPAIPAAPAVQSNPNAPAPGWEQEVSKTLQTWVDAWTAKDMRAYYLHYTTDFQGLAQSVDAWRAVRAKNIQAPKTISIDLKEIALTALSKDRVQAKFTQEYVSNIVRDNAMKTLELVKTGDRWLIVKEVVESSSKAAGQTKAGASAKAKSKAKK